VIGNDLVYLPAWKRRSGNRLQRFRAKVFNPSECAFIQDAKDAFLAEALLWSAKEAAYKIWLKNSRKPAFNPLNFQVSPQAFSAKGPNPTQGTIKFVDGSLPPHHYNSQYALNFLFTQSVSQPTEKVAQTFLPSRLQNLWHRHQSWAIHKTALNIPVAATKNQYLELSLSHDHGFFWYVWLVKGRQLSRSRRLTMPKNKTYLKTSYF
jgi:hypothetical protein